MLGLDFFACFGIGEVDLLPVEIGIASESQAGLILALQFHEMLAVLSSESIQDFGVHDDE
jgi:hypothetical protein